MIKDKNRVTSKIDKAGFMRVFREIYKDNESALDLLQAVLEHMFAIKASHVKTKLENMILLDLDDFQQYLLNHLLAPSKDRILYTAFILYRAISRKKLGQLDYQNGQQRGSVGTISEVAELSTKEQPKPPKSLKRGASQQSMAKTSSLSFFKKEISKKPPTITEVDLFNLVSSPTLVFLN